MLLFLCGTPLVAVWLMSNLSFLAARTVALVTTCVLACIILVVYWQFDASGLTVALRAGSWLLLLVGLIFPLCILTVNQRSLLSLLLLLQSLVFFLLLWPDVIVFYVCFESTTIPLLLLITRGSVWFRMGHASSSFNSAVHHKLTAVYRMLTYTMFGSLCLLPVLLLLVWSSGTSRLTFMWCTGLHLGQSSDVLLWMVFMLVFGIKLPLFPGHLWLPEAHVAAPTAGSVLLSGVFLKLAGFGFCFIAMPLCPSSHVYASPVVLCISMLGLVYGSLATLRQVDLKKVIAYSSVVHMAMLPFLLFEFSDVSITGSMFLMVAHGIVSPVLFILAGQMFDRHQTEFLVYLAGSGVLMPMWRTLMFCFTLANAGMPLFPDFISETLTLHATFSWHMIHAFAVASILVLPSAYSFWTYARITFPLTVRS
jgi:NADH:ubiquinone oxidoreductase subunit 4 (subunit M)